MKTLALLVLALLLSNCSTKPKPTVAFQEQELADVEVGQVKLDKNVVVIDTRSFLNHSLTKLSGSIHLDWRDFSANRMSGDLRPITRRLATYGIHPNSRVVVVGEVLDGRGEPGRIAWTMLYLGISDVQVLDVAALNELHFDSRQEEKMRKNVPTWLAKPVESLKVELKELSLLADSSSVKRPIVIDVRSEKEYLHGERTGPDLQSINIDWREFFLASGRPRKSIAKKLRQLGILRDRRIIVVSDKGLRAGAVAYALYKMGFTRAGNLMEGLRGL